MRLATAIALCAWLFTVGDGVSLSSTASTGTPHTRLDTIRPDQTGIDQARTDQIGLEMDFVWVPEPNLLPHESASETPLVPSEPPAPVPLEPGSPDRDQLGAPTRCENFEPLLAAAHPDWDVVRMSEIMWRESRCQPEARSPTSDTGLLQINEINHDYLSARLGVLIDEHSLTEPALNIAAAALLCDFWERRATADCYQPWVATDPRSISAEN